MFFPGDFRSSEIQKHGKFGNFHWNHHILRQPSEDVELIPLCGQGFRRWCGVPGVPGTTQRPGDRGGRNLSEIMGSKVRRVLRVLRVPRVQDFYGFPRDFRLFLMIFDDLLGVS
jgi:hypothetical protein